MGGDCVNIFVGTVRSGALAFTALESSECHRGWYVDAISLLENPHVLLSALPPGMYARAAEQQIQHSLPQCDPLDEAATLQDK
eukprot:4605038-Amphidinium_carterae.1